MLVQGELPALAGRAREMDADWRFPWAKKRPRGKPAAWN